MRQSEAPAVRSWVYVPGGLDKICELVGCGMSMKTRVEDNSEGSDFRPWKVSAATEPEKVAQLCG